MAKDKSERGTEMIITCEKCGTQMVFDYLEGNKQWYVCENCGHRFCIFTVWNKNRRGGTR